MAESYSIRVATPADEQGINAMLALSFAAFMPHHYDEATLAAALPLLSNVDAALLVSGTYYVAEAMDETIVACGGWTRELPRCGAVDPQLGHMRHYATHPDWTGRGIGRSIFNLCLKDARAKGIKRFESHSSLNAQGFYAALGFVPVRVIDVELRGGNTAPGVLMQRSI